LKDIKVLSHFIQKSLQPQAFSTHGLYRILSSYWLAHFYLMKKVPHYFGLDCKMLELLKYSTHEPSSKEQLLTLPHFWSPVLAKKGCGLCPYNPSAKEVREVERFLYESAQNFEVFSNIK
jgi:hypothetical protein